MACFDSAALEMMLMDRWVINPPRIKIFSVNQVTHLLNGRSRISKHNFSNPTPYWHEHTTVESNFAAHSMTKTAKYTFHMLKHHPWPQMHKTFQEMEREGGKGVKRKSDRDMVIGLSRKSEVRSGQWLNLCSHWGRLATNQLQYRPGKVPVGIQPGSSLHGPEYTSS